MTTDNDKTQTEQLEELCLAHAGEHYESPEWRAAADAADDDPGWDNHWPIVDGDGDLTGDVYESGDPDSDNYANVDDEVMVAIDDLPASEQREIRREQRAGTWEGYADVPSYISREQIDAALPYGAEEVDEETLVERGWEPELARTWAGWYYDLSSGLSGPDDIFHESWNAVDGPVRDNVLGPFVSEAAAARDALMDADE